MFHSSISDFFSFWSTSKTQIKKNLHKGVVLQGMPTLPTMTTMNNVHWTYRTKFLKFWGLYIETVFGYREFIILDLTHQDFFGEPRPRPSGLPLRRLKNRQQNTFFLVSETNRHVFLWWSNFFLASLSYTVLAYTASSKIICSEWNNDSSSSNDWIFSRVSQKNIRFLHFSFSETNYLTRCLRRVLYSIFQKSG